jgi:hypothetical protein
MAAFLPAAINAAGSIGSAWLANQGANRQTQMDKTKQQLVDELLQGVGGQGRYADLFSTDEDAFRKSYIEPAQSRFRNYTAPMIQQSYIAGGQQRNTALDDTLTRAGVDMDSILNSQYLNYQQGQQSNQMNAINSILGQGSGPAAPMSGGQAAAQGLAGYMSTDVFGKDIQNILKDLNLGGGTAAKTQASPFDPPRQGFTKDWRQWSNASIGDPRWEMN